MIEEYKKVSSIFDDDPSIKFMNHGYYPIHKFSEDLKCESKYESSLYFHLLDFYKNNTYSKKILDIGCGRGGGIYYLNQKYNFLESHAVDICEENIEFCKKIYSNSNIKFLVQDAINLKYQKSYFDIVLNVESSHCYKSRMSFFNESFRILKKDGYFLYTNTIPNKKVAESIFEYLNKKYKNVVVNDITENVCESCYYLKKNLLDNKKMNKDAFDYLINIFESKYLLYKNKKSLYFSYICYDKQFDYSYF
jgi:ubiquinone/menaquinone biosynthesis C-methylase UbiE